MYEAYGHAENHPEKHTSLYINHYCGPEGATQCTFIRKISDLLFRNQAAVHVIHDDWRKTQYGTISRIHVQQTWSDSLRREEAQPGAARTLSC